YIETVNGHLSTVPPRPSELADVPPALEELILKCMEKDAGHRPQSVAELRASMQNVAHEMGAELTHRRTSSGLNPVTGSGRRTPVPRSSSSVAVARRGPSPALVYGGIALGAAALVAGLAIGLKPGAKKTTGAETPPPAAARVLKLQVVTNPTGASVTIGGK